MMMMVFRRCPFSFDLLKNVIIIANMIKIIHLDFFIDPLKYLSVDPATLVCILSSIGSIVETTSYTRRPVV